jgi:uncharacterized protein YpmB
MLGVLWLNQLNVIKNNSNKQRKLGAYIGREQMKIYCRQAYDLVSTRKCAAIVTINMGRSRDKLQTIKKHE